MRSRLVYMTSVPPKAIAYAVQIRRVLFQSNPICRQVVKPHLRLKTPTQVYHLTTDTNPSTLLDHDNSYRSNIHSSIDETIAPVTTLNNADASLRLPIACPGCGALSQNISPKEAGFYSRARKAVRSYLRTTRVAYDASRLSTSQHPVTDQQEIEPQTIQDEQAAPDVEPNQQSPVCDRCHDLIYNNTGQSIHHPSLEALADSIAESPFDRNHVYHVLDAADFPLSLIPRVFTSLQLAKPRSQNRRAKFKFTKKPTVSFIITRSDLLGSSKEMVDKLLPYFQSVLRNALGREGRDMRLGNVHLVSAKRGWWTQELKNEIWERGGGNWMVGKVNVGKSNLFPVLFPKGSGERAPVYAEVQKASETQETYLEEESLLPPVQPEVPFPTLPVVSNLPGTTASPIRLSFGNHKGELIDLPGLERGNLEQHVQPDHKLDLVMQYRPTVKKHIIKPGQSLLLGGGLIRITPLLDLNDPSTTMLAYPFVPLEAHVTATDKAIAAQLQERQSGIRTILADDAGAYIRSSGRFDLSTEVTKARAQALLRAKVPLSKLPFKVYSTDILIEGVGWIELVCQIRRKQRHHYSSVKSTAENSQENSTVGSSLGAGSTFKPFGGQVVLTGDRHDTSDASVPQVEISSPDGKHIGQRKPLGASMLWETGNRQRRRAAIAARPRKSMKGAKKREKEIRRRLESVQN